MKKRLLFIDDEPKVLDGLKGTLHAERTRRDMGFVGAAEALDHIHRTRFDAVVSDVTMPGKDGFELFATFVTPSTPRTSASSC